MALARDCYAEASVDHVGRLEYRGLDGVRRYTDLYRAVLDDLAFEVLDQVAEGDRVTEPVGHDRVKPRPAGARGRDHDSRLRDRRIVEDWSSVDTFELLRGLGVLGMLRTAPRTLRAMRDAAVSDA
jgi:predicted ester cyclase